MAETFDGGFDNFLKATINLHNRMCILRIVSHEAHVLLHAALHNARILLQLDGTFRLVHAVAKDVVALLVKQLLGGQQLQEADLSGRFDSIQSN